MTGVTDLRVSVIGAGMGGLATALAFARKGFRRVDVYETASNLGFVGAGIQLAPNLVRVLDRWGCWAGKPLEAEATDVRFSSIRDGPTGRELASVPMPDIAAKYGYPHCTGHRASLAGGLYEACQAEPSIRFHFATALVDIVSFGDGGGGGGGNESTTGTEGSSGGGKKPAVVFRVQKRGEPEPTAVETDLLLGADGIKSTVRTALLRRLGVAAEVEDTGQAAYRIMLTREQMAGDPELLALLEADGAVRWIGERRHIIAYPIAGKAIYNLSTCQPDAHFAAAPTATYTTRASKQAMLRVYADFCPLVQKMLRLVPEGEVCEWRLRSHKVLPTWSLGAVALVGDACHPTLPHLSQGAAMAIEDAAVAAEVLSRLPPPPPPPSSSSSSSPERITAEEDKDRSISNNSNISKALKVYELLRKDRTATLVDMAYTSGMALHLGEGEAKKARDRQFEEAARKRGGPVPDKWASPDVQAWIYSYDCVEDAQEKFDELFAGLGDGEDGKSSSNTGGGGGGIVNGHASVVVDGQAGSGGQSNGIVSTAA